MVRQVLADLAFADDATKRVGAVLLLMADEVDHWLGGRIV
jgi:hypothetical protein